MHKNLRAIPESLDSVWFPHTCDTSSAEFKHGLFFSIAESSCMGCLFETWLFPAKPHYVKNGKKLKQRGQISKKQTKNSKIKKARTGS